MDQAVVWRNKKLKRTVGFYVSWYVYCIRGGKINRAFEVVGQMTVITPRFKIATFFSPLFMYVFSGR